MRIMGILLPVLFAGGVVACQGPTGPQGLQGEAGPGTRLTFSGQLDSTGFGQVYLPEEAGTVEDLPSISVYVAERVQGPFFLISLDTNLDTVSGVLIGASLSRGVLLITINSVPLWYYRVVVVF